MTVNLLITYIVYLLTSKLLEFLIDVLLNYFSIAKLRSLCQKNDPRY
jgi:hypothetical protein